MWRVSRLKQQSSSFPLFSPVAVLTQRKLLVWSEGESDHLVCSLCVSLEKKNKLFPVLSQVSQLRGEALSDLF